MTVLSREMTRVLTHAQEAELARAVVLAYDLDIPLLDRLRDGAKVNVIAPVAPGAAPVAKARRFDPSTLPPEVREKLAKMSPEERRAFIAARRAKAAASSPAEPAAAPASVPARASAARP